MSRLRRMLALGMLSRHSSQAIPTYWLDDTYDSRLVVEATNNSSLTLHDHLLDVTLPAGVSVDADSLRMVELTSLDTVDKAYDWRYGVGSSANHFWFLPVSVSGSTVTVKVLGRWLADETRRFALYWDSDSAVPAFDYNHLNGIAQAWNLVVTAGATSDSYVIVAGGATYTHVMTEGQTAAQIATALRSLVNAGAVAAAAGSSATVTITATNPNDGTFTAANTGTTTPANLAVTKPDFFAVGRVGPDTTTFSATGFWFGYPFHNPVTSAMTRPGWGRSNSSLFRAMTYGVNAVGQQQLTGGVVTSIHHDGPKTRVEGTLTYPVRSGDVDWTGTYSAEHRNVLFTGRKSDNTGANTLTKLVDAVHVVLIYTCNRAYTPSAVSGSATTLGSLEVLSLASLANTFGGNVTEAAENKIPNFSAPLDTGVITAYTSASDLSSLPVEGTIIGSHGNSNGLGLLVNSLTLANFGGQSPEAKWVTQGNAFGVLHLRNLVSTTTIPVGATITVDCWLVSGFTNQATLVGDNLLPDEVVALMQSLAVAPTVSVSNTEIDADSSLARTLALASNRAVEGIQWFQDHALALTTVAGNGGYSYHVQTETVGTSDDDDGNYGEAYKLAGLCLRYLRTHDASLIPLIEAQAQYHIDIEQAAVTAYGDWWEGSAPYWYAASTISKPTEGGISNGHVDPAFGETQGPINYAQGQVRRLTSIDQMHMVALGLYHYRYLLRNESVITANTTLWDDVLALINRMATFEAAHIVTASRVCGNLSTICSGATPTHANGITDTELNDDSNVALAAPYWGSSDNFDGWQINNTDNLLISPSSNVATDDFFRALFAPGSTVAGVTRYLQGMANDMTASDLHHHDVTFSPATWNTSPSMPYPQGWMLRAGATGNTYQYDAGRSGDKHYLELTSGVRDVFNGRSAQRLIVLCLTALLNPTYTVPVEMNSTTVLRNVALREQIDATARVLALYGVEPTTKAQRQSAPGWLGRPSANYDPQIVDSALTGYWMMAVELWHLVNTGASYADYYPIGQW